MRITATAPDGVSEAMEGEGILCVQFHPESMYEKHPEMLEIYKDLVERAKQFKKK
jgi:putative glutamine amidotransferase